MRKKEAIKKKAEFQVKIPPFFEYCKNLYLPLQFFVTYFIITISQNNI